MNKITIRWILVALIAIAGIWLYVDHGQHIAPYLPLAFFVGMLAMHLFGHGSHGGHDNGGGDQPKK